MTTASERRQRRQTVVHTLPLAFTVGREEMFAIGQACGRSSGRDRDWVPGCLDEAIMDALLDGHPSVTAAPVGAPFYPLQVVLIYDTRTLLGTLEEVGLLGDGQDDLDRALVAALQARESPVELGFEYDDFVRPTSAHAAMDRARLYDSALATSQA